MRLVNESSCSGPVAREAIPNNEQRLSQVLMQRPDERLAVVAGNVVVEAEEVEAKAPALRRDGECTNDGPSVVFCGGNDDGCFTCGRPSSPVSRLHHQASLVDHDERSPPPPPFSQSRPHLLPKRFDSFGVLLFGAAFRLLRGEAECTHDSVHVTNVKRHTELAFDENDDSSERPKVRFKPRDSRAFAKKASQFLPIRLAQSARSPARLRFRTQTFISVLTPTDRRRLLLPVNDNYSCRSASHLN